MTPKVAAIIPCYNTARYVGEAVGSALAQTYDNLEVIVVNDGSTDAFDAAIETYRPRITLLIQANRGLAAARNRGIEATDSDYVAFLDADDRWHPMKIEKQIRALAHDTDCGLVHAARRIIDATGSVIESSSLAPAPRNPAQGRNCLLPLVLPGNSLMVSSVTVKRSVLGDERFAAEATGVEDWDMWLRLAAKTAFAYIDEPLIDYRVHGNNMSGSRALMWRGVTVAMERTLARERDPQIQDAARLHRKTAVIAVGNIEYEQGNRIEARKWFRLAGPAVPPMILVRRAATYLPDPALRAMRRMWQSLRARDVSATD